MKKIICLLFTVMITLTTFSTPALATNSENSDPLGQIEEIDPAGGSDENVEQTEDNDIKNAESGELSGAGEEILGSVSKKDKRIAELSDKYNDKTLGTVAYGLEVVRYYSTPIFFILLTIGAFNFFIIGNKKLDKKEQGFSWITACIIGWVFFQCIPLIFALFTL